VAALHCRAVGLVEPAVCLSAAGQLYRSFTQRRCAKCGLHSLWKGDRKQHPTSNRHANKGLAMNTTLKTLLASITLALAGGAAMAQTATPVITQHQANQAHRIQQGVASGQLTRHEAVKLHRQQAHIRHAKRLAKADGVVTHSERRHLRALQAKASRHIRHDKHDAQTAVAAVRR
jgi:hypothetical protein